MADQENYILVNHIAMCKVRISFFLLLFSQFLIGCASTPPSNVNNLCSVFRENPHWHKDARSAEQRWKVPVHVQMAIIHQESKFNAVATPPRTKLFSIIPWRRPSSAHGYAQALHSTWKDYQHQRGGYWVSRENFSDAVDFIGWYANAARIRAHIPQNNAYALYLAYHEGIGGYLHKSYLRKPWLINVAKKVQLRSEIYAAQTRSCHLS